MTRPEWADGGPYQAWADFLEQWAEGALEATALPNLEVRDYAAETWVRLGARLDDALTRRMRQWTDGLTAALSVAVDDFTFGRALAQSRAGLLTIRAVATHPGLSEGLREKLTEVVDRRIRDLQEQLGRELDRLIEQGEDPRRVEAKRRAMRDNLLTVVSTPPPPAAPPTGRPTEVPTTRRRVLGPP